MPRPLWIARCAQLYIILHLYRYIYTSIWFYIYTSTHMILHLHLHLHRLGFDWSLNTPSSACLLLLIAWLGDRTFEDRFDFRYCWFLRHVFPDETPPNDPPKKFARAIPVGAHEPLFTVGSRPVIIFVSMSGYKLQRVYPNTSIWERRLACVAFHFPNFWTFSFKVVRSCRIYYRLLHHCAL